MEPSLVRRVLIVALSLCCAVFPSAGAAQTPAAPPPQAPPPTWAGALGAGLSLTRGNSDTLNFNVAFDLTRTPEARNVMELKARFLRGESDGSLVTQRTSATLRDRHTLSGRTFLYGQVEYLRDTFKLIDYLIAPTVGVGFKLVDTESRKFFLDAGVGSITEKNSGAARTNAAVTASEKLAIQLTPTSSLKHEASGLWKTSDFSDALYTFSFGLATKISERTQLSLDLLDTFRTKRPSPFTKRNDVALVASIVAKF